jgi:hypothetical protein
VLARLIYFTTNTIATVSASNPLFQLQAHLPARSAYNLVWLVPVRAPAFHARPGWCSRDPAALVSVSATTTAKTVCVKAASKLAHTKIRSAAVTRTDLFCKLSRAARIHFQATTGYR